jgi:hypothetical protein
MFGWLRNLFAGRNTLDTWNPKERLLFHYFDGKKMIHADPMVVYKSFMEVGPELKADIDVVNFPTPIKGVEKAHEGMITKIRKIFQVETLENGGLTEIEVTDLLDKFLNYCDAVKKNGKPLPTLPATSVPSAPSSGGSQPTPNSSASGSTAAAPSTSVPPPSPSVPASPSAPSPQASTTTVP